MLTNESEKASFGIFRTIFLILGASLLLTIILMIIPMSSFLIDILVGFSFIIAFLFCVVSYSRIGKINKEIFSNVVIVTMSFRLALSATITRLNMLEGDSEAFVELIGTMMVMPGYQLGMVLFLILSSVQVMFCLKSLYFVRRQHLNAASLVNST